MPHARTPVARKPHRSPARRATPARATPWSGLADQELLEGVLARRSGAWEELLERFRGLLYRCISRVLDRYEAILSNEDIEEVFSDLCVNLVRDDMHKLRAWNPERGTRLGTWLGLLAINASYDFLRTASRRPVADVIERASEVPCEDDGPLESLLHHERWLAVGRMIDDFSERDRRFVELYYSRDMLAENIAGEMGISVKTVYSKKNKIQTRLQRLARDVPDLAA